LNGNFHVGEWLIEPKIGTISTTNKSIRIEPKVMQVLVCLADHSPEVVLKERLIQAVWKDTFVTEDVLTRSISELRRAFGDNSKEPTFIQTIPRSGYRLIAPVSFNGTRHHTELSPPITVLPDPPPLAHPNPQWKANRLLWAGALLFAIGSLMVLVFSQKSFRPALPPMKVMPFTSFPGSEVNPAFSPDGKKLAFSWNGEKEDNFDIYVAQIDAGTPHRLTLHAGSDMCPAWSPDGTYIAFSRFSDTESGIYIVPSMGGAERKVVSTNWQFPHVMYVDKFMRIDWSPDGKYLAFPDRSTPQEPFSIFLLSLETNEKRKLTLPPEPYWNGDWAPTFSPDGQTVAFIRGSSYDVEDIYFVPIAGGEPRRLTFDNVSLLQMAWTADGREIVFTSTREGADLRLWRVPAWGGVPEPMTGGEKALDLTLSRQGQRFAYTQTTGKDVDIWRMEISPSTGLGITPTKFIASTRVEVHPQYSPDGNRIVFESTRSGSSEIWMCNSDGSNLLQLTNLGRPTGSPCWSPDGRQIAFDSRPEGHSSIFVLNIEGGQTRRITTGTSDDIVPSWSRDGRSVYFTSNRNGESQIWKVPVEGGEGVQVTNRSEFPAIESLDGKFLYYVKMDTPKIRNLYWIPVEGGQETLLSKVGPLTDEGVDWAVTKDGIYFISPQPGHYLCDIKFFNFATGRVNQVSVIEKVIGGGLAVSPDGRWLLYVQLSGMPSSDIMWVENFR
jgi:Tol biopolymer transport system component/DNA-binding winged helix-turn-helix (wHTH) protein